MPSGSLPDAFSTIGTLLIGVALAIVGFARLHGIGMLRLGDLVAPDRIHALVIRASAPGEA